MLKILWGYSLIIKVFISLIIYLFACCPAFGNSFSSGYVITQSKNNSSVSVHKTEEPNSKVVAKVSDGTPMSCSWDSMNSRDFCAIKIDGNKDLNWGFVNKKTNFF